MLRDYDLFLHYKQGDDFSSANHDFANWASSFEECARQTRLLAEHAQDIEVTTADTHCIMLRMEEDLAKLLMEQNVNLSLFDFEQDGETFDDEE